MNHHYSVYVAPDGVVHVFQRPASAQPVMVGCAVLAVAIGLAALVEATLGQGTFWPWLLLLTLLPAFVAVRASRWRLSWGTPEDLAAEAVAGVEPDSSGWRRVPASWTDGLARAQGGPEGAAQAHDEFLAYGHTPYYWSETNE